MAILRKICYFPQKKSWRRHCPNAVFPKGYFIGQKMIQGFIQIVFYILKGHCPNMELRGVNRRETKPSGMSNCRETTLHTSFSKQWLSGIITLQSKNLSPKGPFGEMCESKPLVARGCSCDIIVPKLGKQPISASWVPRAYLLHIWFSSSWEVT